jgi:hypothetical protein
MGAHVPRLTLLVCLLAAATGCSAIERAHGNWSELSREPSGQAPDASVTPEAVVQVYAARTVGWRGLLAVHTWIALKPGGAPGYTRYEVIGWGVDRGMQAVRVNRTGPDNYWFGSRPDVLVDLRGGDAEPVIEKIQAAVAAYPYRDSYRTWPGPNSNTFTAFVGREVPELRLKLPSTAIGKDYLVGGAPIGVAPSGTGLQISLLGLVGVLGAWEEGVEVNVLGLAFGLDVKRPALKLPALGRLGLP